MQVKYNSLQGEKVTSQYPRVLLRPLKNASRYSGRQKGAFCKGLLFMDTYEETSPVALGTDIHAIDLVYVWPIGFPSNKYLPGLQNIP